MEKAVLVLRLSLKHGLDFFWPTSNALCRVPIAVWPKLSEDLERLLVRDIGLNRRSSSNVVYLHSRFRSDTLHPNEHSQSLGDGEISGAREVDVHTFSFLEQTREERFLPHWNVFMFSSGMEISAARLVAALGFRSESVTSIPPSLFLSMKCYIKII